MKDILETEDMEESENSSPSESTKVKRAVSFADEDDSETLQLTFQHSIIEPSKQVYDPAKGIQKPNDIYEAFPHLFNDQKASILKKSKYEDLVPSVSAEVDSKPLQIQSEIQLQKCTIVLKDVIEKLDQNDNELQEVKRPVSIFKKRRQQMM